MVGKHSARKQDEQQQQAYDAGQQSMAAQAAPADAAPSSSGPSAEDMQRLAELGRLHDQGILTDEEFSQQKSRILGL